MLIAHIIIQSKKLQRNQLEIKYDCTKCRVWKFWSVFWWHHNLADRTQMIAEVRNHRHIGIYHFVPSVTSNLIAIVAYEFHLIFSAPNTNRLLLFVLMKMRYIPLRIRDDAICRHLCHALLYILVEARATCTKQHGVEEKKRKNDFWYGTWQNVSIWNIQFALTQTKDIHHVIIAIPFFPETMVGRSVFSRIHRNIFMWLLTC